jgi:hypothetical protein
MSFSEKGLRSVIIVAPFIFIAHFLEEAPGFVSWFNSHVSEGITSGLFWSVNVTALIITVIVTIIELFAPSSVSAAIVVLWFSFLMLANAIFHITGGIVDKKYVPGLTTAALLYIPYYFLIVSSIVKKRRLKFSSLIILVLSGSAIMLAHGYLILFRGSRLF